MRLGLGLGFGVGGVTLMVINHSITHLSEFRQVGEREGGPAGVKLGRRNAAGERRKEGG